MILKIFVFFFDFKPSHDAIVDSYELAKSMLKVNKSLLIPQQIMHVTWQNIP
jgi:hypothetical protein